MKNLLMALAIVVIPPLAVVFVPCWLYEAFK